MRDDLLDAYSTVDWAKFQQIPILEQRIVAWQRNGPYNIDTETDPVTGDELVVASEMWDFLSFSMSKLALSSTPFTRASISWPLHSPSATA